MRIEKDNIDILLINVYMPSSNCSNREQEFSDILSEVSIINDIYSDASLILGGNFNFDYIRNRDSGIVDKIGQFNTNNCTVNCRELPNIIILMKVKLIKPGQLLTTSLFLSQLWQM